MSKIFNSLRLTPSMIDFIRLFDTLRLGNFCQKMYFDLEISETIFYRFNEKKTIFDWVQFQTCVTLMSIQVGILEPQ